MMRLLELAGLKSHALERILESLPTSKPGWGRDWMVDLLKALAVDGSSHALDALLNLAASGEERAQDNLATADDAGLQWVAEHVLPTLSEEDRWQIAMWLPDETSDDKTPTQRRLRALYDEEMQAIEARYKARPKRRRTSEGFLRNLGRDMNSYVDANDFARRATPRQWRAAAKRFLRETRGRPLRTLTRAFRQRDFPLSVGHLFRQATHPERGWAVMRIIGTLDTPVVRRFALSLLRRRPLPWTAIDAIEASLRPGDEPLILEALRSVGGMDNVTRHAPILDTVALFRKLPEGKWQSHAEWIVEHSPCSVCRGSAVDWLAERGLVPEWVLAEGPYDAEPNVRHTIGKLAKGP